MRDRSIIILLFIFSVSLFSCSKYEDGPSFSVIPKKNRVVGKWELVEVISQKEHSIINPIKQIEFKKNFTGTINRENSLSENMEWSFNYNKEQLRFDYEYDITQEHYGTKEIYILEDSTNLTVDYITSQQFYILRLKNTELWIKGYFDIIYKYKKVN